MYIFTPLYLGAICITSICLIANSFLVYFASKLSSKEFDIKLVLILASLEFLAPIAVLSDLIYYFINGQKMIENQYGCNFYGFIIIFIYHYEMVLSSLLSMERLSKIKKSCLFNYGYYPTIINLIIFRLLLIACAVTNSFVIASTKLTCQFNVTNSILASVAYHYSLLSGLVSVGLLIYSYYCLANKINEHRNIILVGTESIIEACSNVRPKHLKKASIEVYLILISYATCMLSSIVTLFLESILKYKYGDALKYAGDLNVTAAFLFVFGIIFNTLLVLTLHAGVAKEVKCFMQKKRKK